MNISMPVAHYEKVYEIYSNGKLYNKITEQFIKPIKNSNGYYKYLLSYGDKKQISVHRLVAKHFLPNPYDYSQINHKDGNKANNNIDNLEWCTSSQNRQHALKIGLVKGTYMSNKDKRYYLDKVLAGESTTDISKNINRPLSSLSKMLRNFAEKEGRLEEWTICMKKRRKQVAIKNLPQNRKS